MDIPDEYLEKVQAARTLLIEKLADFNHQPDASPVGDPVAEAAGTTDAAEAGVAAESSTAAPVADAFEDADSGAAPEPNPAPEPQIAAEPYPAVYCEWRAAQAALATPNRRADGVQAATSAAAAPITCRSARRSKARTASSAEWPTARTGPSLRPPPSD